MLTRDDLLRKTELKKVEVKFNDGTSVYVREMTGHERDAFEKSITRVKVQGTQVIQENIYDDFRAKLAVHTLCDDEGELLLKPGDVSVLSRNMSATKLMQIADAAAKINGITPEEKEDLVKNLKAGQTGDSSSDSAES